MRSIRTKMLLIGTGVVLLVAYSLGGLLYLGNRRLLLDEVNDSIAHSAQASALSVAREIGYLKEPLTLLAQNLSTGAIPRAQWREVLRNQLVAQTLDVALVDETGRAQYLDGQELDLSDRPYIQRTLSGEPVFSSMLISRVTGEPVIMMAEPLFYDGRPRGALIARLDRQALQEIVLGRGYGERGYAYLVSTEGNLLGHRDTTLLEEATNVYQMADEREEVDLKRFLKESLARREGTGRYQLGEEVLLAGFSTVPGTDWVFYSVAYEEEALRDFWRLRDQFFLLSVVLGFFALILTALASRHFTAPILALDRAFQRATAGDLTQRLSPYSSDEIGRATENFNRMMGALRSLTYEDPVTGVPNLRVLAAELAREGERTYPAALLGIDGFSLVNEKLGYSGGDELLSLLVARMKRSLEKDMAIYRGKGDEFLILTREGGDRWFFSWTQRLVAHLLEPFEVKGESVNLQVSVGVDRIKAQAGEEMLDLLRLTHARNVAREKPGSQVFCFDETVHAQVVRERSLDEALIEAVSSGAFDLVYQPIYALETGEMVEAEALIRWKDPHHGQVSPERFIAKAEKMGLIEEIDRWVIDRALLDMKTWPGDLVVSINLSADTFERREFPERLMKSVRAAGLSADRLQLELTERVLLKRLDLSIERVQVLKSLGFRLAIDDFGVGYSSLHYLANLPADVLKIDKSFIQGLTSARTGAVVEGILQLARRLEMRAVAEGIETVTALKTLKKMGCYGGQGFHLGRPMKASALVERIERKDRP